MATGWATCRPGSDLEFVYFKWAKEQKFQARPGSYWLIRSCEQIGPGEIKLWIWAGYELRCHQTRPGWACKCQPCWPIIVLTLSCIKFQTERRQKFPEHYYQCVITDDWLEVYQCRSKCPIWFFNDHCSRQLLLAPCKVAMEQWFSSSAGMKCWLNFPSCQLSDNRVGREWSTPEAVDSLYILMMSLVRINLRLWNTRKNVVDIVLILCIDDKWLCISQVIYGRPM